MLRVFLDVTSPIRIGETGRLKWAVLNPSDEIITEINIWCSPPTGANHVIHEERIPRDCKSPFVLPPGRRATLSQVVDLTQSQDRFFSFQLYLKIRTITGNEYSIYTTEEIELDELPAKLDKGPRKFSYKGGGVFLDKLPLSGYDEVALDIQGNEPSAVFNVPMDGNVSINAPGGLSMGNTAMPEAAGNGTAETAKWKANQRQTRNDDLQEVPGLTVVFIAAPVIATEAKLPEPVISSDPPAPAIDTANPRRVPQTANRATFHLNTQTVRVFALDSVVFGRWIAEGNAQADILLKAADPAQQDRVSARHFLIHHGPAGFNLEDVSRTGLRVNGQWSEIPAPVPLGAGASIDLTRSMRGVIRLQVRALCKHALYLAHQDRDNELFVLLLPETPAGEPPSDWNPALPWLWHHQGGFWPLERFGTHEGQT